MADDHGGGLDWGPSAWGEAGGFAHVLGGGSDHFPADAGLSGQSHVTQTTRPASCFKHLPAA